MTPAAAWAHIVLLLCACGVASRVRRQANHSVAVGPARPPEWSRDMQFHKHLVVPEGHVFELVCVAIGNPRPTVKWFWDGKPVEEEGSENDKVYVENGVLKFKKPPSKMSGNYTCLVQNEYGHLRWTFTVAIIRRVPSPPIIRKKPASQTAVEGSTVTFECRVLSLLPMTIKWLRNFKVKGSFIDPQGKPYLAVIMERNITEWGDTSGQMLILRKVKLHDAGWYTCVVKNEHGVNHNSAWLEVMTASQAAARSMTTLTSSAPAISALHTACILIIYITTAILNAQPIL